LSFSNPTHKTEQVGGETSSTNPLGTIKLSSQLGTRSIVNKALKASGIFQSFRVDSLDPTDVHHIQNFQCKGLDFPKEASILLLENLGSGFLAMHNLPVLHFLFFFLIMFFM
jgi:hypothetical protein